MNDLTGKRALVTGGGTGVGATIAGRLAAAGATVTIAGRRPEPLLATAAAHPGMKSEICDVTDEGRVIDLFERADPFDIVVANAGNADSAPMLRTDLELWQRTLEVNLTGVFLTFREGLKRMSDWGRLITVASTAGLKGYGYVTSYCAAKHGVIGLVRALALETARRPVTVNALCPGFTETPLLQKSVDNIMAKTGKSEEEARAALAETNPQQRLIQPDEVAAAALWLCGPGSEGITGQAISISGGET